MRFGPLMSQIGMAVRPILETVAPNAICPSLSDMGAMRKLLNHFKSIPLPKFNEMIQVEVIIVLVLKIIQEIARAFKSIFF